MTATKRFILFASLMFLTTVSCAQLRSLLKGIDEVDLIMGPGLVSMRGSEWAEEGRKFKMGYTFGMGVRYCLNKHFLLGGKILFERKGSKQQFDVQYYDEPTQSYVSGKLESNKNFDYITLPVLLRYSNESSIKIYFETGLYLSYLLKERTDNYLNDRKQSTFILTENFTKIDIGLPVGLGCLIPIKGNISATAQISTNVGLFDINNFDIPEVVMTNSTSVLLGISLKTK